MIKLVIFDMAGTSINEDNLVYKTIREVLVDNGKDVDLSTVLAFGAGKEKSRAIRDILRHLDGQEPSDQEVSELHSIFKNKLDKAYDLAPMEVFPSVREVIEVLKSKQISVAFNTGYSRRVAEHILNRVDIDIDALCTASDVDGNRPDPDMIDYICEQLDIPQANTVKIGDSAIDIEEGKNAGVHYSIGVTTGAQNRTQLAEANPDYIFDDMKELLEIV